MMKGWSIDPDDWDVLEKVIPSSLAWKSVILTPIDQNMVPESPGVYAICAPPPNATIPNLNSVYNNLSIPIYIGRSETNLRSRFIKHCQTPDSLLQKAKICFQKVKLSFWFISLNSERVKDAEAQLITCFGPPVNKRAGTITGIIKPPLPA